MPMDYSDRLMKMRNASRQSLETSDTRKPPEPANEDIRESLNISDSVEVVFPLSDVILGYLNLEETVAKPLPDGFSQRLYKFMQASEILWTGPFPRQKMVFKCAPNVVVKAVRKHSDHTEYTTLQFLQNHRPSIPAPRPLGLVRMSGITLIFITYTASKTLDDVWKGLDHAQKSSISNQLDMILKDLRSIPYDPELPLGGVAGEGCKDIRRHLRTSDKPIKTIIEFEDFLSSSPQAHSSIFVELLRQLSLLSQSQTSLLKVVFTHGDLRPDNIMIEMGEDNQLTVSGLLDWEYSGFYPEYYEAVRCTNCLAPCDRNDWYLFLPKCVSPKRYAQWWLLDRVRETMFL
ncbi:hypothetical protein ASPZODRAFT_115452 [Penicilliopsis zonata CBS 506.65]|uniref:Aminoglycoside phosphotransferase domain-containing protein n=1 Tax=Penicilliopsis zonata CBS 506.65 TaxID=1073090 RepID=A0A1L9SLR2_9EURO|nr:hypothetical protein ASPZODRAFT_115452 [Penicilliopsis zonata CBS 506.65]OJJ48031.1 hypothetical protein ASPZODRAFT_115452 [Penicilliopsis zonata CBS 506.65]